MPQIHARVAQDIEPLAESEHQFRELANSAPVLIWRSGTNNLRNYFNLPWLRFTGRTVSQELGMGWAEGIHPDDHDKYVQTYMSAFAGRQPFALDYRLRRHDGVYRWVRDNGSPFYRSDGSFAGYFGSAIDITDREESSQRLAVAVCERDELMAELHHRIKNNLQIIVSLAGLQSAASPDATVRQQLRNFAERIQSLAIAQEQLYHARNFGEIDIGSYLGELARSLIASHGRTVRLESRLSSIRLPATQATPIGLIVNELISNALKHAWPPGQAGTVTVGAAMVGDSVEILVGDDGMGLPAGFERNRAFGFRLIDSLVGQMKATLDIDSGNGTRFTLRIAH